MGQREARRAVASWWKENGEKRKAKLGPILKEASARLEKGKTLVIGATEAEMDAYAEEGRELSPTPFIPRAMASSPSLRSTSSCPGHVGPDGLPPGPDMSRTSNSP
jgi:hypothetical protein